MEEKDLQNLCKCLQNQYLVANYRPQHYIWMIWPISGLKPAEIGFFRWKGDLQNALLWFNISVMWRDVVDNCIDMEHKG